MPEEKKNPIFCTLVCHAAFSKVSIYMPLCNRIGFIFSHLLGICLITDFCTLFVFSFFEILFLFSCRILNFHPQVWSTKPEMKYGKLLKPCYDSVKNGLQSSLAFSAQNRLLLKHFQYLSNSGKHDILFISIESFSNFFTSTAQSSLLVGHSLNLWVRAIMQ